MLQRKMIFVFLNLLNNWIGEIKKEFKFKPVSELKKPKNLNEFDKNLRRNCKTNKEKYDYFMLLESNDINIFFNKEIDTNIMSSLFESISNYYNECII